MWSCGLWVVGVTVAHRVAGAGEKLTPGSQVLPTVRFAALPAEVRLVWPPGQLLSWLLAGCSLLSCAAAVPLCDRSSSLLLERPRRPRDTQSGPSQPASSV